MSRKSRYPGWHKDGCAVAGAAARIYMKNLLVLSGLLAYFDDLLILVVATDVANGMRYALVAAIGTGYKLRGNQRLMRPAAALLGAANLLLG